MRKKFAAVGVIIGAIAGILGIYGAFLGGEARAEGDTSTLPVMTISPMNQRMILVPGEERKGAITISNAVTATSNLNYTLSVGSFSQRRGDDGKDDYGAVDVDEVTIYNQMMNWITLDRKEGSVAPNETQTITFTIKVPEDAPAGGQYATILIQNVPDAEGENGGAGVMIESVAQMASIIYADVAGETHKEGSVLENKVPTFLFDNNVEATSMIENKGNVHTDAEVLLQIWSAFGGENICSIKEAGEEETAKTLVLPGTKRYHQEECKLPGVGIYKVKQTVKIFGEESVVEGTLIYCPIWVITLIIFAIAMIIIWLVMMAMARRRKIQSAQ